ncbi:PREDICTED: mitogen-activated protein kinase kinase 2-like [Camelina sativa]|uniref:Mitogen-activated protein kinase kinase 2-like n=1 Tax=Camelina sativa TaxID=90675 RepID=A0ABM0VEV0_CAMSA|nr:PREDICTED: mitogen-activated protein kinase kinase 2-like [Camelina sativa]
MEPNEEFVKVLGKGAYSYVDLVKYTRTDGSSFHAAVKSWNEEDSLRKEIKILSELRRCPRIVQFFGEDLEQGFDCEGNKVYKLLLEYASVGSLRAFMDTFKDRKLPDLMIRDFTRMILEGLVSIHGHGYVHCDLKPDNLLVFPSGDSYELKISDFGLSLEVGKVPNHWKPYWPFVGTPYYMPPESLRDGAAKKTIDLWSLGCLVLEMYMGKMPWPWVVYADLVHMLLNGNAPEIPESLPYDAREFIQTCFARNPEDRGSAFELLSYQFLHPEETFDFVFVTAEGEVENQPTEQIWKLKSFPSKPLQFKKILNKFLRLHSVF